MRRLFHCLLWFAAFVIIVLSAVLYVRYITPAELTYDQKESLGILNEAQWGACVFDVRGKEDFAYVAKCNADHDALRAAYFDFVEYEKIWHMKRFFGLHSLEEHARKFEELLQKREVIRKYFPEK